VDNFGSIKNQTTDPLKGVKKDPH